MVYVKSVLAGLIALVLVPILLIGVLIVSMLIYTLVLLPMPDRADHHSPSLHPIQNNVGSSCDDELPNSGFWSDSPQVWMVSQRLDYRYDPDRQSFRCFRFVLGYVRANFP
jgi:hypothetical protein